MYNIAIRQTYGPYRGTYTNIANKLLHPYIVNATIQFRIQDILGVQKNIGLLRCGGGGARGSYLAHGQNILSLKY